MLNHVISIAYTLKLSLHKVSCSITGYCIQLILSGQTFFSQVLTVGCVQPTHKCIIVFTCSWLYRVPACIQVLTSTNLLSVYNSLTLLASLINIVFPFILFIQLYMCFIYTLTHIYPDTNANTPLPLSTFSLFFLLFPLARLTWTYSR